MLMTRNLPWLHALWRKKKGNKQEDKGEITANDDIVEKKTEKKEEDEKEVTANDDFTNALVAVCENDEEKRVAALSDQMRLEMEAKLRNGDIDGGVKLGTLWMQLHGRVLKKKLA
mmetsp:Transcript_24148/g.34611  ORF Transcript_24148/g.34611 Transcript_24148/m.34611 type:complete len:115 (+) Transcript_24148:142-486(+)